MSNRGNRRSIARGPAFGLLLVLVASAMCTITLAQEPPPPPAAPPGGGEDPPGGGGAGGGGVSSITDLTVYDHLSLVARAPGVPEGSIFAGFENSESVQAFNGNLLITHPSSPSFPLDGGGSFSLFRSYNSSRTLEIAIRNESDDYRRFAQGRSWVGYGWTMHLGRVFKRAKMPDQKEQGHLNELHCYHDREFVFEDGTGTQTVFNEKEPDPVRPPIQERPILRVRFFRKPLEDCEFGSRRPFWCDSTDPARSSLPECDHFDNDCETTTDGTAHYEVTLEDGSILRLEKRVDEDTNDLGFIKNTDRSGWYTTRITFVSGAELRVAYHNSAAFPEAIAIVESVRDPGFKIQTTLCASDADCCAPGAVCGTGSGLTGRLKTVTATGPGAQTVTYEYLYEPEDLDDVDGPTTVPLLRQVKLPVVGGQSAGSIQYTYRPGYQPEDAGPGEPGTGPLLERLIYPLNGEAKYAYGAWYCGPKKSGAPSETYECYHPGSRRCFGVTQRTLFPAGSGGTEPARADWSWDRDISYTGLCPASSGNECLPALAENNRFVMRGPDGRTAVSEFESPVACGPGINKLVGRVKAEESYDGDGTAQASRLRRVTHAYVFPQEKSVETEFYDGPSACEDGVAASPARMRTEHFETSEWGEWNLTVVSGDYLPTNGDDPPTAIERRSYIAHDDPKTMPLSRLAKHVVGRFGRAYVEEGRFQDPGRYEVKYWHEGDPGFVGSGNGRLRQVAAVASYQAVGTTVDTSVDPNGIVQTPAAPSSPEAPPNLLSVLGYDASKGNLANLAFSGGDSSGTYTVNYTWDQAMAKTMKLAALSYNSREIVPDRGAVSAAIDPNGLRTDFGWDALGRVTSLTPPGPEYATRVAYPSLLETRVIRSPGTETAPTTDPEQVYSDQRYDGLGRTIERRKTVQGWTALQVVRYDALGREIFVSEWLSQSEFDTAPKVVWEDAVDPDGTGPRSWSHKVVDIPTKDGRPWGTVTYYGVPSATAADNPLRAIPDGLGRVRRVVQADGSIVDTEYCGPHETVTVRGVDRTGDGVAAETSVTKYWKDGLGRLVMVDTDVRSGGTAGDGADAIYRHDPRGNIRAVHLVPQLPSDAYAQWQDLDWVPADAQTRTFVHDAVGRLREATNPEKGREEFHAYDVWGNLLAWTDELGRQRGYHFRNTFDGAGRLTKTERWRAAYGATGTPSEVERLGSNGTFEGWPGAWVEGTIDASSNFQAAEQPATSWEAVAYGPPSCFIAPPVGGGTQALHIGGADCNYNAAGSGREVARIAVAGVTRDDLLSFKYWRQVREQSGGSRDKFEVWVTLQSKGASILDRHVVFRSSEAHASYAKWIQSPGIAPGDFFSPDDWPEGTTRDLFVYLVFEKGDSVSSGLGTGILVDDLTIGRQGVEVLQATTYDIDVCSGGGGGDACLEGASSVNAYKDKPAKVASYRDNRKVLERRFVYRGLNGRLSGVRTLFDWRGMARDNHPEDWTSVVWNATWNGQGLPAELVAPYATAADKRRYSQLYYGTLLRRVTSGTTPLLVEGQGLDGVYYDAAGELTELRFANGAGTAIARDAQHRPQSYAVWGSPTTERPFWASENYTFDGAGNITAIGQQRFGYDGASRLTHAELLPQAQSPSTPTFDVVNWTYDLYGNMTGQTLVGSSAVAPPPPPLTFQHTYGAAGPANHNQVTMSGFAYDGNGNSRRFTGQLGSSDAVGALWDAQNRLTAFVQGDPWAGSAPGETYAYDADGYRFLRLSLDNAGKALLSVRDGEGRTLSEFVDEPSGGLKLVRDFVYGVGQLLVERQVTSAPPQMLPGSPLVSGGSYHLTVSDGSAAPSYELDIRTASGFQNRLTGLQRDAAQQLHVPESALSPGETNVLRLRAEGEPGTGYSVPVSLLYDPSVTPSSPNQIRALGVSRNGTDLVLRWALLTENGKQTRVSFRRADTGATYVLTPQALASSIKTYTLSSQALASPCGDFLLSQVLQANETGPTPPLRNPSSQSGTQGTEIDPCDDPPPDPAPGPRFTNAYHHRDHLGTLRNVTGDGGYLAAAYDWYPYGTRMRTGLADSPEDSRRMFTGHERDLATGLDYMMARYYSSSWGTFLSVDPGGDNSLGTPQSWNAYSYVRNNPINASDPTGKWLETAFDVAMAGVSIKQAWDNPSVANVAGALLDVAAVAIPIVPAVGGRAIDAAQAGNKLIDAAKGGGNIVENAAKGKAAEQAVATELKAEGKTILGSQVQAQTSEGTRVIDHLVDNGGTVGAVEVKSGDATRSASQVAKDNAMATEGATLKGKNAPEDLKGKSVKIETEVRKPKQNQ